MALTIQLEPGRTAGDFNWTMLRIPVRVHPTFWLGAMLLSYTKAVAFTVVLIVIACMFVSILVHELGHALCYRHYGDSRPSVVLYYLGGLCRGNSQRLRSGQRIFVSLWGPGAGFVLGVIAYAIGAFLSGPTFFLHATARADWQVWVLHALISLVWINFGWGLLNLLPIFPLDGGNIVREWLAKKRGRASERLAFSVSFYAAIVCALGALVFVAVFGRGDSRDLIPVALFSLLAYQSYVIRRHVDLYGSETEDEGARQAWERDADWWKDKG